MEKLKNLVVSAAVLGILLLALKRHSRSPTTPQPVLSASIGASRVAIPRSHPLVSNGKQRPAHRTHLFEAADFGRLPRVPAGYHGKDSVIPLIGPSGLPAGRTLRPTTISVGRGSCPLGAGVSISLLLRRGDYYLADIRPVCQTAGTRIREGYIPVSDIETH